MLITAKSLQVFYFYSDEAFSADQHMLGAHDKNRKAVKG